MAIENQVDSMFRRNRHVITFTIVDPQAVVPGDPLDLTGKVVKYSIARFDVNGNPLTKTPIVDLNSNGAQVVIMAPATAGVVEVTLLEVHTTAILPNDYYFECEVFDGSGNGVVTTTGTITIKSNVENV